MNKFILLYPLVILSLIVKSQDLQEISHKIDSLKAIKQDYERKLQTINSQISTNEQYKLKLIDSQKDNSHFILKIIKNAELKETTKLTSNTLYQLITGDTVEVLDYTDFMYKVKVINQNNLLGYVWSDDLDESQQKLYDDYVEMKERLAEAERVKQQQKVEAERLKLLKQYKDAENKKDEQKRKLANQERQNRLTAKYGADIAFKILQKKIWIGMTKEMAIDSWGRPNDINRTVTATTIHEQWVYGSQYLYFDDGILTTWQD